MAFETDLLPLLTQTLSIQSVASRDGYGKRTYGTAVTYPCRVTEKIERVVRSDGREEWAKSKVWVAPNQTTGGLPDTSAELLVTLPDGTQPPLIATQKMYDQNGVHHVVLYFGDTSRVV